MSAYIYIRSQFTALHRWAKAPDSEDYLRNWHRHTFHVKLAIQVGHNERQVEFFALKRSLDFYLQKTFQGERMEYSCETIAEMILVEFRGHNVDVSEDGVDGAVVVRSGDPSLTVQTQCFFGIEVEGLHKGASVMFVPGQASELDMTVSFGSRKVERVYYGAGNDRRVLVDGIMHLQKLVMQRKGVLLDIELDDANFAAELLERHYWHPRNGEIILFQPPPPLAKDPWKGLAKKRLVHLWHKSIAGENIQWFNHVTGRGHYTWLFHPQFSNDQHP